MTGLVLLVLAFGGQGPVPRLSRAEAMMLNDHDARATLYVTGYFDATKVALDTDCGCVKGMGEAVALAEFIEVQEPLMPGQESDRTMLALLETPYWSGQ